MIFSSVVLALALVASPALPGMVVIDEKESHGESVSAAKIFGDLFSHLTPHVVGAVWVGGEGGLFEWIPLASGDGEHDGPALGGMSSAQLTEALLEEHGGRGQGIQIYNINTVQWIAGFCLVLSMVATASRARSLGDGPPRGGVYGIVESIILFVRDEMVYPALGREHGRGLAPLFLTQFFFILFLNLFGLVPDIVHSGLLGTATANLAVTGALALTTFLVIHGRGIAEHGPVKHWGNFIPHVPWFVLPIIVPAELAGIIIKPFALCIRLFANMTAGHLVLLALFGLVQLAGASLGSVMGGGVALPVFAMAVAIGCLELLVAFVQAYIFTYLSIVFIGASLHPDH